MDALKNLLAAVLLACVPAAHAAITFPGAGIVPADAQKSAGDDGRVAVTVDPSLFKRGDASLALPSKSGKPVSARFDRIVSRPDGRWSWVATVETDLGPQSAVLTFGDGVTFGLIPQPEGPALRIDTVHGKTWLSDSADDVRPDPADSSREARATPPASLAKPAPVRGGTVETKDFGPVPLVDVLVVYTPALVAKLGTEADARALTGFMETLTNQAFVDSRIPGQVRVVAAQMIDYTINSDNNSALDDIFLPSSLTVKTTVDTLRAQYGADLVVMLRDYDASRGSNCGVAEINGYHGKPFVATDGFAVVNYGSDSGQGCPLVTFAHELGHNFGSHHDYQTAGGGYGAWIYSRGHKENVGSGGFGTIMSYPSSPQTYVNLYSNPALHDCQFRPCGIVDYADNRRTFSQSLPLIAAYQPTVVTDATPTLSVADATTGETDEQRCADGIATCEVSVQVTLSEATTYDVTFDIATADGSARAGEDYVARSVAGVVIPAGMTHSTFLVRILDDEVVEASDAFHVVVSNVRRAQLGDGEAVVTIIRDFEDTVANGTHFAGGHWSQYYPDYPADKGDGGPATDAWFWEFGPLAAARDGNVYIVDANHRVIRRVGPDGIVTMFSGDGATGAMASWYSVDTDRDGNLYALDIGRSSVYRFTPAGAVTKIAGNGAKGWSGDGGPATAAGFEDPWCLAVAPDGRVVVGDNTRLREIGTDGIIRTIAGTGTLGTTGDGGPASAATVTLPFGCQLGFDDAGRLFVGSNDRIRRIETNGTITLFAGGVVGVPPTFEWGEMMPATQVAIGVGPMAVDRMGGVMLYNNTHGMRRITPDGFIDPFGFRYTIDGQPAINQYVSAMAFGPGGALYLLNANQAAIVWRLAYPEVPEAPASVTATAGNARAALSFPASADVGGGAIVAYETESSPAGGNDAAAGSTALSRNVTGLANGTAYRFRVRGHNAHGAGPWSPLSNAVTPSTSRTPTIAVADAVVIEGQSGTKTLQFAVTLSAPAPAAGIGYTIATADGTAKAGSDYVAKTLSAQTIAAGQTSATFAVTINGDTAAEGDETFTARLSAVTGASIARATATGTIRNDDTAIAVRDLVFVEGHSGLTSAELVIELSRPSALPVTFTATTADATAVAGDDYLPRNTVGRVIAPGSTRVTVPVRVIGEHIAEPDETFTVALSAVTGASVSDGSATVTIRNDDAVLTLADVVRLEGEGDYNVALPLNLSTPAPLGGVSFRLRTLDGTATGGNDFNAISQTVVIPTGASSATIYLLVRGDGLHEGDEEFTVVLDQITGSFTAPVTARYVLLDDDFPGDPIINTVAGNIYDYIQIGPVEGGRADDMYLPSIGAVAGTADGRFLFAKGSAIWSVGADGIMRRFAGSDTAGYSGDGGPAISARFDSVGDIAVDAADRIFVVDSNNRRIRVIAPDGTITTFAGNGSEVVSGDGGAAIDAGLGWIGNLSAAPDGTLYFTTLLDNSPWRWAVRRIGTDGVISTVVGGGGTPFPPGADEFVAAEAQIPDEPGLFGVRDGQVLFTLSNGYYSSPGLFRLDADGVARRIAGDPEGAGLNGNPAIAAVSKFGGNAGGIVDASGAVYFSYAHLIYRLSPGGVIERVAGSAFNSGFNGDGGPAINALMNLPMDLAFDGLGRLLVVDKDNSRIRRISGLTALPSAPRAVAAVAGNASATVTFQAPASAGTSPITGYDVYSTPAGGIDPGGTSLSRTITGLQNGTAYTFRVRARSALGGGPLSAPSAPVTPYVMPTLSIADVSVAEGNSGTKLSTFTVKLSAPAPMPVRFNIATSNGTATSGSDYVARSLSAQTIAAGASSASFNVTINGDTAVETDETYTVTVSGVTGATVTDGRATGTITNDDVAVPPPALSIADVSITEGNSGTKQAVFTVLLSKPAPATVTYSIATANGTATAGSDYVARSLTAQTIAAGASSASVAIVINGDAAVEANETFTVTVSAVTGATVADGQAMGTIVNDDGVVLPVLAARADRVILRENAPAATISVLANDLITASRLTTGSLTLVSNPALGSAAVQTNGTATAADDTIRYTAPANANGDTAFRYRLCENDGRCAEGLVQLVLRPALDVTQASTTGSGFVDLAMSGLRALPTASFVSTPLVAPVVSSPALALDTTLDSPWDASRAGTALVVRSLPVPADGLAKAWRVLVDGRGTAGDIDLYLGQDLNGNSLPESNELLCTAAMSSVSERCELALTHPGTGTVRYWVMAHNRHTAAQSAAVEVFEVPLDAAANGTLIATGPGRPPAGAAFPLRLSWSDPGLLANEARLGYVRVRTAGTQTGLFPVRINRTGVVSAPFALTSGVNQSLRLAAGTAQDRLFIDVPAGASTLTVTTTSSQNVDLYLAKAATQSSPDIGAAPARSAAQASAVGATGNESLSVSGAALTPGRWYVTPVNPGTGVASLTVRATITGVAPVVRSGSYFNASRPGHGLLMYPAGDSIAGLWYTYLQDGSPTWYYLQGVKPGANGIWTADLYRAAWGGSANALTVIGKATATPTGPDAFRFTYSVDGQTGSEPLAALGRGCPTLSGTPLDVSSHWFNPAQAGPGYSVQMFPNYEFYSAFVFDAWGVPRYLLAESGSFQGATGTMDLVQMEGFCPLCTLAPTVRHNVGTFSRTFSGGVFSNITMDAIYADGVPGVWSSNEPVQTLGGPGTTQGCQP